MGQTRDAGPAVAAHPEVALEQAYLDHAYRCLAAMRERARRIQDLGFQGVVYADGMITDAQDWENQTQRRVDSLADTPSSLCFGRIDPVDDGPSYIGRRHVEDDDGQPVVTDWRAPVSAPFYRATVADPLGLRLRRRFLVEGRHLADVFDEDFTDPSTIDAAYVPDPLLAELERARTGEMRDIVATIQAEQDVIIRAPIDRCIVVQGGPGTGKTAVGLHRAAFLLYEHRELLERNRLLIVGPNRIFLRYISQVLPSLGETASVQITIEGLAGQYLVRAEDPAERARLKGDVRMAELVGRAVHERIGPPAADLRVATSFGAVTLPATEVAGLVEAARSSERAVNASREVLREQLVALAWRLQSDKATTTPSQHATFVSEVRADKGFRKLLDQVWPNLSAAAVARRVYGRRNLSRLAEGLFDEREQEVLARVPSPRVSQEQWTRADLAVLDEAEARLNGTSTTYGHVVVDEAQDLSAMELRMIARRSRGRSMTVLGDLAQATAPGAQTRWDEALGHLAAAHGSLEELEVGYRVPAPILDYANRLLPEAAPHVTPARSVRVTGEPPALVPAPAGTLATSVATLAVEAAARWTSVAVVGPRSLLDDLAAALAGAGVEHTDARRGAALGDHVTLLPPPAVKGLEFDAVIVVEPGLIVTEEPSGVRILYVALTRAVQHLAIAHAGPLPGALEPAVAG